MLKVKILSTTSGRLTGTDSPNLHSITVSWARLPAQLIRKGLRRAAMTAEEPRITHLRSVCQGPGTTLSVCILFIMFTTTLQGRFEQSQFTHKDQQSVLIQGHIASVKMPTPKSDVPTLPLRLPSVPALWAFSVPSGDSSHRPGVSRVYMWLHRPLLGRVTTVTRSCSPFTPQIILFVKARASKFASLPRGHL